MVFTHTVTKTRMNTQSIHIHFIYIHHSMGSMCSHILTHHASPIFDLGHFLFYKAWQSWPAWVIIFLYPVDQRFINMSHVWLCRTEPGLAVVPGSSVQPSSPVLLCFVEAVLASFFLMFLSLESQNSYQPTSTTRLLCQVSWRYCLETTNRHWQAQIAVPIKKASTSEKRTPVWLKYIEILNMFIHPGRSTVQRTHVLAETRAELQMFLMNPMIFILHSKFYPRIFKHHEYPTIQYPQSRYHFRIHHSSARSQSRSMPKLHQVNCNS